MKTHCVPNARTLYTLNCPLLIISARLSTMNSLFASHHWIFLCGVVQHALPGWADGQGDEREWRDTNWFVNVQRRDVHVKLYWHSNRNVAAHYLSRFGVIGSPPSPSPPIILSKTLPSRLPAFNNSGPTASAPLFPHHLLHSTRTSCWSTLTLLVLCVERLDAGMICYRRSVGYAKQTNADSVLWTKFQNGALTISRKKTN